ncbi:MAG: hypothetical protein VX589_09665 [Myxococcota bacterium]|nr:hypothetical protein [Myxococcota bacterium]
MRLILIKLNQTEAPGDAIAEIGRALTAKLVGHDPAVQVRALRAHGVDSTKAWDLAFTVDASAGRTPNVHDGSTLSMVISDYLGHDCACVKAWSFEPLD